MSIPTRNQDPTSRGGRTGDHQFPDLDKTGAFAKKEDVMFEIPDKCKFCGAEAEEKTTPFTWYKCLTTYGSVTYDDPVWNRGWECYESELDAIKKLMREMGKKMDYCADWFAPPGHGHPIADEIRAILSCPEVRRIMEEE
jgi:hypothetical protein